MSDTTTISPARTEERTKNPLRPERLADVIGQDKAKELMSRAMRSCWTYKQPLDHVLLVGPSGTGKSTFSHVIGHELGVDVYDLEAPLSVETLLELREVLYDGDIIKVEEIHQQAIMERRGRQASTRPEVLYAVMEDRVLPTQQGLLEYPHVTFIGTTTDEGMLPDAFVNRFPLRPRLVHYTTAELAQIVRYNADKLAIAIAPEAVAIFAGACRGVPREVNNLMRNARVLAQLDGQVSHDDALMVLDMNGITEDGLTADMQAMLVFLYTKARQETGDGDVRHQASVNTIATAIGKSRDSKAIALRVEPYLIELGYVQVTHGGRRLTDAGLVRARELVA